MRLRLKGSYQTQGTRHIPTLTVAWARRERLVLGIVMLVWDSRTFPSSATASIYRGMNRASLRSEKDRLNIDIYRGYISDALGMRIYDEEYWRKGTNHEPNNLKLQPNKKTSKTNTNNQRKN